MGRAEVEASPPHPSPKGRKKGKSCFKVLPFGEDLGGVELDLGRASLVLGRGWKEIKQKPYLQNKPK